MTDQLERDLTTMLHRTADATNAPPAPVDLLVREGDRARSRAATAWRRRTAIVVAAAAVVAAAIPVGVHLLRDDAAPTPTTELPLPAPPRVINASDKVPAEFSGLPKGPLPAVPYLNGATELHVVTTTYRLPAGRWMAHGQTVLAYRNSAERDSTDTDTRRPSPLWVLHRNGFVRLGQQRWVEPWLSYDGRTVFALQKASAGATAIAAWDTATGEEIGETAVPYPLGRVSLDGADAEGRVFWDGYDANGDVNWLWRPGRPAVQIAQPQQLPDIGEVAPHGVVLYNSWHEGRGSRYATVTDDGNVEVGRRLPLIPGLVFSEDGSLAAYAGSFADPATRGLSTTGAVFDLASDRTVRLLVPDHPGQRAVNEISAFERDSSVIVRALHSSTGAYLRCSTTTGRCDRIFSAISYPHRDYSFGYRP